MLGPVLEELGELRLGIHGRTVDEAEVGEEGLFGGLLDLGDAARSVDRVDLAEGVVEGEGRARGLKEVFDAVLEDFHIVVGTAGGLGSEHDPVHKRLLAALIIQDEIDLEKLVLEQHRLFDVSREAIDEELLESHESSK